MKKRYSLLFSFLVFFIFNLVGQNQREVDSLQLLLPKLGQDTLRIQVLNQLARYLIDINPEKSLNYANEAFELSKKQNLKKYQAASLINVGNGYYNLADYKACLDYYLQGLKIQEEIGNKKGILSSCGSIGNVFIDLHKPDDALKYFDRALKIAYELNNKNGIASCLLSMGVIYSDKHEYPKSLDYSLRALKIFIEVDNEDAVATSYNNIADSYQQMKDYPKALVYITKADEIYKKIGNVYGQSLVLNNLGSFYHTIGNEEKALEYYKRGLESAKSIGANDHILASYKGLSTSYKKMKNYEEALVTFELFKEMNDSIYNVENSKQISEMQARFDSEKNEQKIAILTKDKKIQDDELNRQAFITRTIIGIGVLFFLLSLVVVRAYIQKKNVNRELDVKNKKIELAYNIIEDQHKDIKDSINYAKRIQEAILPPEDIIKQLLPDSFVLYIPKDIVSGDFYWVEPWGDKILFAAVDCTGHGVPGALMSIVGYNLLGKAVNELGLSRPALILNSLSKGIGKTLRQTGNESELKDGMDIAICSLDYKTKMLEYAGASNPVYIIRASELIEIHSDKIPIGTFMEGELKNFTHHEFQLQEGDTIYIFTDGYADQFGGAKGKKFKYKALQQLLISIQDKPMNEQNNILTKALNDWKGALEQVDDILIMGVRI